MPGFADDEGHRDCFIEHERDELRSRAEGVSIGNRAFGVFLDKTECSALEDSAEHFGDDGGDLEVPELRGLAGSGFDFNHLLGKRVCESVSE